MKEQKIYFYVLKWFALIFLSLLIAKENQSKIMMFILIGFVAAILIWEGIRDFKTKNKIQNKSE
jgi:hypothetical protein